MSDRVLAGVDVHNDLAIGNPGGIASLAAGLLENPSDSGMEKLS